LADIFDPAGFIDTWPPAKLDANLRVAAGAVDQPATAASC
jgi:hypothetical protein